MIFFSQLFNVPVVDSKQEEIGRLKDVLVKAKGDGYPQVSGIMISLGRGRMVMIPEQYIENLGYGEVTLKKSNCWEEDYDPSAHEILLARDVLDQQIFDVAGIRVVRVNDLELVKIEDRFSLIGIDVSNRALMRRLGLGNMASIFKIQSRIVDWNDVSLVKGPVGNLQLKTSKAKLAKLHPADIANLIENLNFHESTKLVQSLDDETAAEVLQEVEGKYKDTLLEHIPPNDLADIVEEMPSDQAVDVIQDLSLPKRQQVFRRLAVDTAKEINTLSSYAHNVAGGLMTSDFLTVPKTYTVVQAVRKIRKTADEFGSLYHVFVVNEKNHLVGIVSIRTLFLAKPTCKVQDLMAKVVKTVNVRTHANDVAKIMTKYNLLSVAVVDRKKILRGIVTVDDILRLLVPDA